jgi:hypothetical protein
MSTPYETWNVNAADFLQLFLPPKKTDFKINFGGVASPVQDDDYSDVLAAPDSVQAVLDHLDEPTTSG